VTFEWDANTEVDLVGYRLYQSTTPGVYNYGQGNEVADIAAGTMTATITVDGRYYYVLTAYDTEGFESEPSNEVRIPMYAPTGLTITIIIKIN
jgi:fibronectin type 3 domain-containing protein